MTPLDRHAIGNLLQVILGSVPEGSEAEKAVFEIVKLMKPKVVPVPGVKVVDGKPTLSFEMGEL